MVDDRELPQPRGLGCGSGSGDETVAAKQDVGGGGVHEVIETLREQGWVKKEEAQLAAQKLEAQTMLRDDAEVKAGELESKGLTAEAAVVWRLHAQAERQLFPSPNETRWLVGSTWRFEGDGPPVTGDEDSADYVDADWQVTKLQATRIAMPATLLANAAENPPWPGLEEMMNGKPPVDS